MQYYKCEMCAVQSNNKLCYNYNSVHCQLCLFYIARLITLTCSTTRRAKQMCAMRYYMRDVGNTFNLSAIPMCQCFLTATIARIKQIRRDNFIIMYITFFTSFSSFFFTSLTSSSDSDSESDEDDDDSDSSAALSSFLAAGFVSTLKDRHRFIVGPIVYIANKYYIGLMACRSADQYTESRQ